MSPSMQFQTLLRARSRVLPTVISILAIALILVGCGRSRTPEAEELPTIVPTIEAPTAVPEATEPPPTATISSDAADADSEEPAAENTDSEDAADEATTEEPATEESADVEAGEQITATDAITETAQVTATEAITESQEVTDTTTADAAAGDANDAESTDTASEEVEPRVFFRQPTNHAILPITATINMGVEGLEVEPAGEVQAGAGHFHILIEADFVPPGDVIPNDESHRHFGDGSTEIELGLAPGLHILRLQFADGAHIALEGDEYRDEIIVRVVEDAPEQSVRLVVPTDGAVVPPTFQAIMAATGLIVEPAGEIAEDAGHFHLLVDEEFIPAGDVIPNDETHLHFGGGQLETELTLESGEHELRLQFADGAHIALEGEQYRDTITVTVEEDAAAEQVMFVEPEDGATVSTPVSVQWAAAGLIIEPAGPVLREGGGHLHVLVDEEFIPSGEVIPNDETHLHFGGAQTAAEITLEPGEHTLRLQMANGGHIAMEGDQYRDEITITVEE